MCVGPGLEANAFLGIQKGGVKAFTFACVLVELVSRIARLVGFFCGFKGCFRCSLESCLQCCSISPRVSLTQSPQQNICSQLLHPEEVTPCGSSEGFGSTKIPPSYVGRALGFAQATS